MYPQIKIDMEKLKANLDTVAGITIDDGGCSLMVVTKVVCADPEIMKMIIADDRVSYMADSRIANIKTYEKEARAAGKQTVLLRIPMHCEVSDVIKYVDLSFNSELSTIRLLDEEAGKAGKKHKILLMIDLGDLREGMFFRDEELIFDAVSEILSMENIELYGLGTNLTCYGAIIPKQDNLSVLTGWARKIEERFNIKLQMVSGGNSSSIYLIWNQGLPEGINNLRLGESLFLGNDTAYETKIKGTRDDAIILETQIVELKEKPSIPVGETGVDAFGNHPVYEDRGIIQRAIIGVGRQDTEPDGMTPLDEQIDILGASSDHMILDLTKCDHEYKVGDIVPFKLSYGALLKTVTSKYVDRVYV